MLDQFTVSFNNVSRAYDIFLYVYRSYYSSAGCAGEVAQYDIVTDLCSLYDYPIGSYGTFECDALGEWLAMFSR